MPVVGDKIKKQNDEKRAYAKMLSYGWTPEQASGIVGNLVWESRLDTSVLGTADDKGSRGIAQWHSGRLKTLQNRYGNKWTDLDNQLEYVNWELNNSHKKAGDKLKASRSVNDTGRVVSDDYEKPKDKWNVNKKRQAAVYDIHKKYSGVKFTEEDMYSGAEAEDSPSYRGELYSAYLQPNMTSSKVSTEKEDTVEEAAAKEKIEEVEKEQDILSAYFSEGTQQPQQPQQQEYQQPQEQTPEILDQYTQISQFVDSPVAQEGGIPISSKGVYAYPMQEVIVPTNNGRITMNQVSYPILGTDELGNQQMMYPGKEYKFPGKVIHEAPQLKNYFNKSK
jgi:hypothetical protein